MTKVPNFGIHSLETEYLEARRSIYKKFVKFFCIIIIGTILTAVYQTFDPQNLASSIKPLLPLTFFFFVLKYLYCLPNQELGGMVIYLAFYLNGLYTNYYGDNGLDNFKNPENAFYFGCYYGILERLVTERVCKPHYKVYHTIMASAIRLAVVFTLNPAHYILQVAWACVTIYLDLSQEKYNNHLFTSYFNYKEQLIKFKDLVVNDIPEGLAILSKDLLNNLFTNKHFNDIVSNPRAHIRRQLDEFIIQDAISDFDPKSKDLTLTKVNSSPRAARTSPFKNKTLLTFLQDKLSSPENPCSLADFDNSRTFSCRLSHVKNPFASADSRQEQIFEARIFPITWEKQSSIAIILHDITLHHTILSLQLADLHKDAVLATVSHELRTPLNGMLGIIQIMQKKVEDKELLNYLSICEKSGELLIGLVNSILDLNQIRANTLKLYPETFNLSELMKDAVSLFKLQCEKKDLYLKLNIAPELPKTITTDKNRLTQIFINLIGNALKFTFQGGITVSALMGSEQDSIKFVVEDTGIGIEEEDKEKLFKIFGKIHHANNENLNKQGVGLGLTISNKLASLLNNHNFEDDDDDCHRPEGIQMKSLSSVGSIFTFEIKADLINKKNNNSFDIENTARQCNVTTEGNEEDLEETNLLNTRYATYLPQNTEIFKNSKPLRLLTRPKSLSINKEKPCVLLVDDNSFNLMVAEVLVRTYGYEVVTASHGQKAIELVLEYHSDTFKKSSIKLILMDCQMPVMDGYKATLALREMMKNNKIGFIPIIALTANDGENERKRCLEVGMVDHLSKPLKDADLKNILKKFVKN